MKKLVIIGMGLIGGSIGKAALKRKLADEVIGVCRRDSSLERAIRENSLTRGFVNNYAKACKGADLVIIATPVHTIKEVLDGLKDVIKDKDVLVTDVGSTKREIVDYASMYSDKFTFIGAHPLAGSEKTGVENAREDLFENSLCILTPQEDSPKKRIEDLKKFWESLGASVEVTSPDGHDEVLAFTSHLPHIAAFALSGIMERDDLRFTSTGFKDTTRIASSDPVLWNDILMSNKKNVLTSIEKYKEYLTELEKAIETNNAEILQEKLTECKEKRDELV